MLPSIARTAAAALVAAGVGWSLWIVTEEAKLIASDGAQHDQFGYSVAVSGDTAIVGSIEDDNEGGLDAGAAYVFVKSGATWSEQQKLAASDGVFNAHFGSSVAVSGDTALVAAFYADAQPDSVYVFARNGTTWSEQQKLASVEPAEFFGYSVALSGDTAVIGVPNDNAGLVPGEREGSVLVFVRSGTVWTEQQQLNASDPKFDGGFGNSVAIQGDTVLVGASNVRAAYVFVRSGTAWSEQQELLASGAQAQFGVSVALSGDTAVVGAPFSNGAGAPGSAYVFLRGGTTWAEQQELTPSDPSPSDGFGSSVAISGELAVVGAHLDDHAGGNQAGSAYVYARSAEVWSEQQKVTASDAAANDQFGHAVGLSGESLMIGASLDDHAGLFNPGSAYAFTLTPGPANSYCTAGISASGCQALLSAAGTASATSASGFTLSAASVEGQKDGLFFFGTNGQQANPWGNGTSYQCVVPPVVRTPTMAGVGIVGLCDGSFTQDLNALWCPSCPYPAKNPGAGATVQTQLWYRDPLSTSNQTTSLSDAVEFAVGL